MILFLLTHYSLAANFNGDLSVELDTSCNTLYSENITSSGSLVVDSSLVLESVTASYVATETIALSTLKSPSGTIEVYGNVILSPSSSSASFYQTSWTVQSHESFSNTSEAWASGTLSKCDDRHFLQGDCASPSVSKQFSVPEHKYIRLSGSLDLLDVWEGERLEIRVDGRTVWSRTGRTTSSSTTYCSRKNAGLGIKFDVLAPHTSLTSTISFVSTLQENNCKASFGIKELTVLTR